VFIFNFIERINSNPSIVRCFPSFIFIYLATLHQSIKSKCFTPTNGYFENRGIILFIFLILIIVKFTTGNLEDLNIIPEPK